MGESKQAVVYFTADRSPQGLVRIYDRIGSVLKGKIGVKANTDRCSGSFNLLNKLFYQFLSSLSGLQKLIFPLCSLIVGIGLKIGLHKHRGLLKIRQPFIGHYLIKEEGLYYLAAGIPIGVVGFLSGIGQGRAAASALQLMAKRPDQMAKGIIYTVMVETYAILAFVVSILIWLRV